MKYNQEERRKHGCDGCRKQIPTEKFEGYCGNNIWLCHLCLIELIEHGLKFAQ